MNVTFEINGLKGIVMHVRTKPLNQYPWYIRLFFWKQKKTYGKVLEPGLLWARAPKVFMGVALLYGALNRKKSPINPALRSLVTVRVSQINHCEFCVDINATTLMKRGVCADKVENLADWKNYADFDEEERLALEMCEAMTFCDQEVGPELIARMKQRFDDDYITELCGLIAFQNMSSKYNAALAVPAQGFCKLPLKSIDGSA